VYQKTITTGKALGRRAVDIRARAGAQSQNLKFP
jgi:hypothetical protein